MEKGGRLEKKKRSAARQVQSFLVLVNVTVRKLLLRAGVHRHRDTRGTEQTTLTWSLMSVFTVQVG